MTVLQKIISGGQTGADRAALDFAIEHGIPHGGWCPAGRRAEDGVLDPRYQLKETPSDDYVQRTEWNVRDSDGTVVFSTATELTEGSKETMDLARRQHKPCLHLWRNRGQSSPGPALRQFIHDNAIKVLNVAGPRASNEPEVGVFVNDVLKKTFGPAGENQGSETKGVPAVGCEQPTLETPRLRLRPCTLEDAPTVARLAGRREIADTTISIPHPYSEQQARDWVGRSIENWTQVKEAVFASNYSG